MFYMKIFILLFLIYFINSKSDFDFLYKNLNEYKRDNKSNSKVQSNWILYKASFYSREETKDNMPASGIRGSSLKEALQGYGRLQVSVDNLDIPLYTRFYIKLWDDRTIIRAIALDIGPGRGNLDILVNNITEAINYGIKNVKVQFIN